jgi:hypothetical protein
MGDQLEEGVSLVMVDNARLDAAELAEEVLQLWFASPAPCQLRQRITRGLTSRRPQTGFC